jgi:hypothetical protein
MDIHATEKLIGLTSVPHATEPANAKSNPYCPRQYAREWRPHPYSQMELIDLRHIRAWTHKFAANVRFGATADIRSILAPDGLSAFDPKRTNRQNKS